MFGQAMSRYQDCKLNSDTVYSRRSAGHLVSLAAGVHVDLGQEAKGKRASGTVRTQGRCLGLLRRREGMARISNPELTETQNKRPLGNLRLLSRITIGSCRIGSV